MPRRSACSAPSACWRPGWRRTLSPSTEIPHHSAAAGGVRDEGRGGASQCGGGEVTAPNKHERGCRSAIESVGIRKWPSQDGVNPLFTIVQQRLSLKVNLEGLNNL